MPLAKIIFNPGINREATSYGAANAWFNSDLVRFRKGHPEKMGGWVRLTSNSFLGTPRSLHTWATLDGSKLMGIGTTSKFYIEEGQGYNDITPLRRSATLGANPFTTGSAGSGIITVTDAGHGATEGDYVTFSGATATDGLTTSDLNKEQTITVVVGANSYKVDTGGSATSGSTAGGGSAVLAQYQISPGLEDVVDGTGWGAGPYGGTVTTYSQTTLDGGINDSVTSIALTSASDFETAASTNSGAIVINDASITLADSSGFPSKGTVLIDSEKIRYGTNSSNVLGELTRGDDGTTAAAHSDGTTVTFVGLILVGSELIQYTGKSSNTLDAGVTRAARGTTAASHSDDATVKEANDFIGWGQSADVTITSEVRIWGQDNWGEDLVFNIFDGTPYYWDKTLGLESRATTLASQSGASGAPTVTRKVLVSGADRHLICLGCNPINETDQDLLMVRWSDQEDPVDWTPSATNTAGSQRLSSGSDIISAQKTRQEILIWTDATLYSMRFVGPPFTFGFSLIGSNVSVLGPNTTVTVGDQVFWMDNENFYVYTGRIQPLPCTVLRYVFDDINLGQAKKFFGASNKMFNEVMWFYVSSDATEIDRYVKYNFGENVWDIGSLSRTAWVDYGIHTKPRAGTATPRIFIHEDGDNDDGSAMTSFIESSDFDLDPAGEQFMSISRLIPDIKITTTDSRTVDYILKTRNFPGDSLTTNSTSEVGATTQQSYLRSRARQAVLRIESSSTNVAWTMGDLRLDIRPDGRR